MPRPCLPGLVSPARTRRALVLGAAAFCCTILGLTSAAFAQPAAPAAAPASVPPPPRAAAAQASKPQPGASAAVGAARPPAKAASAPKANSRGPTKPLWRDLGPAEQQALAPLAGTWDTISNTQKRKWLALSQNFPKMSSADQTTLHSRMTEWVALSPQQRAQARLNFGVTRQLSPDDKKAKWEAYQALPPEEKRKLAASAAKPPATAPALKPVPADKLATVPKPKSANRPTRTTVPPGEVERAPALPPTMPASMPARAG